MNESPRNIKTVKACRLRLEKEMKKEKGNKTLE